MGASGSRVHAAVGVMVALAMTTACAGGDGGDGSVDLLVGTLPNGASVYSYASLVPEPEVLAPDLSIGTLDGDPPYVFGDVRGIDADADGTIYVLDTQASEIRTYDAAGQYLATIATRGEGPGEIGESNGIHLAGDSLLWVQDYRKWAMLGLGKEGGELARVEMPVRNYAYMWNGAVDDAGRIWKEQSHSGDGRFRLPEPGLVTSSYRAWQVYVDPGSGARDSIDLGDVSGRTYVVSGATWNSYMPIPFEPRPIAVVDPKGGVWLSDGSAYRVARLDLQGDTVMVIEVGVDPVPVTDADREDVFDRMADVDRWGARAVEEVVAAIGEEKPAISALSVDDRGNLWIRRGGSEADRPRYDVFTRDGGYLGAVRFGFTPSQYFPLRVRRGNAYLLMQDELDVPSVARVPLPEALTVES